MKKNKIIAYIFYGPNQKFKTIEEIEELFGEDIYIKPKYVNNLERLRNETSKMRYKIMEYKYELDKNSS